MCLILFALDCHPRYRLVLAANREEFHHRPTAPATFWAESPSLLAGRDLLAGGTWLGITRSGRIAALTNYREPDAAGITFSTSRGWLVRDFLLGSSSPEVYLEQLQRSADSYAGYSIIIGDRERLCSFSNRGRSPASVTQGIHGLSNHLLGTPWPKVLRGTAALGNALSSNTAVDPEALFTILADRTPAADRDLPMGDLDLAQRRLLSAIFVTGEHYGTRTSTLLLQERSGLVTFMERTHRQDGTQAGTAYWEFAL